VFLGACESAERINSKRIAEQFEASGNTSVDLAQANPEPWDKVCVLGPYATNAAAREMLGFEWDVA
jgi:hypothetical protein